MMEIYFTLFYTFNEMTCVDCINNSFICYFV